MESLPINAMRFKVHLTERLNLQLQHKEKNIKVTNRLYFEANKFMQRNVSEEAGKNDHNFYMFRLLVSRSPALVCIVSESARACKIYDSN